MENIKKLLERMRKADERTEEIKAEPKPSRSNLTDKQKYLRQLRGSGRK